MKISYHEQSIPLVLPGNELEGSGAFGGLVPPYTVMIQFMPLPELRCK